MSKSKVPEIRFEGFDEEWEENLFKTITKINQGLQIPILNRYTEKIDNSFFYITNEFLKENSTVKYYIVNPPKTVLCTENDILMTRTGNTGEVVTNIEGAFHNNFFKIKFDREKLNKNYLVYFLKLPKTKALILRLAGVSTIPDLNHDDFYKISISYSKLDEQTKIGNYFQNLDKLISQKEKKQKTLKQLKKAMIAKMFPKSGVTKPEIRFEGFCGEWEEKTLGKIAKITMGQSPNGINYTDNPKDYILVQGNADMKNGLVVPRIWTKEVTKTADIGDLIFSVRAPVGEIGKTKYDIVIGRGVASIKGNEFIFQSLKKMNENGYWKKLSAGSTFDSINSNDLRKAILSITVLDEQTKIGNYFQKLDKLIELQEKELEKLKQIKKASLDKMFVS